MAKKWTPPLRRSLSGKPVPIEHQLVSTSADREAAAVLSRRSRGLRFGGPLVTPKNRRPHDQVRSATTGR